MNIDIRTPDRYEVRSAFFVVLVLLGQHTLPRPKFTHAHRGQTPGKLVRTRKIAGPG